MVIRYNVVLALLTTFWLAGCENQADTPDNAQSQISPAESNANKSSDEAFLSFATSVFNKEKGTYSNKVKLRDPSLDQMSTALADLEWRQGDTQPKVVIMHMKNGSIIRMFGIEYNENIGNKLQATWQRTAEGNTVISYAELTNGETANNIALAFARNEDLSPLAEWVEY